MPCIVQYWGGCPGSLNAKWRRFHDLLKRCAAEGWRTCIVFSRRPERAELVEPFEGFGCEVVTLPRARGNFDFSCVRRTNVLMRRVKCDVLHVHNVHTSPLIGARLAGVPARVWSKLSMSSWYEAGVTPRGWRKLNLSTRVSGACAHRVLCLSSAVLEEAAAHGVPREKLAVLPGSVDVEGISSVKREEARRRFGLDSSDRVISTVGHAVAVKGWDVLVEAFADVVEEFPRAKLWLIGSHADAHERGTYEKLVSRVGALGLSDRVEFSGRRDDIPMLLGASDVFAFPSRSEGQGSALNEAMAAGLPCVASAVGGIVDSIDDGRNGLLVPREDVGALAAAMKSLLADASMRDRLGRAAAVDAQEYSHSTYVDSLMRVYGALLGKRVDAEK